MHGSQDKTTTQAKEHRTEPFASWRGRLVQNREVVVKVGAAVCLDVAASEASTTSYRRRRGAERRKDLSFASPKLRPAAAAVSSDALREAPAGSEAALLRFFSRGGPSAAASHGDDTIRSEAGAQHARVSRSRGRRRAHRPASMRRDGPTRGKAKMAVLLI